MQPDKQGLWVLLAFIALIVVVNFGLMLLPLVLIIGAGVFVWSLFQKKQGPRVINIDPKRMNSISIEALITKVRKAGLAAALAIVALVVLINSIVIIPAGETGVYHLFGKVRDNEVSSGIHLINPLASIVRLSIRTEQYTMSVATTEGQRLGDDSIEALTKEGLKVHLDMTVLYHLEEDKASDVYREIGVNYDEKILRPAVRTAIRDIIALYEAKDIYSDMREEAVRLIKVQLEETIGPRGLVVEEVLLRNVALPAMLTGAIENKLTAEQEAERYDFVLERETKEAERKRIEAEGQRDAQTIINQSLTDRYLQYLYVQNLQNREGTIYVPYDMPLFRGM